MLDLSIPLVVTTQWELIVAHLDDGLAPDIARDRCARAIRAAAAIDWIDPYWLRDHHALADQLRPGENVLWVDDFGGGTGFLNARVIEIPAFHATPIARVAVETIWGSTRETTVRVDHLIPLWYRH